MSEQIDSYSDDVNNWIKNMLTKAVDGSWNVGISNAGSILGDVIGKYLAYVSVYFVPWYKTKELKKALKRQSSIITKTVILLFAIFLSVISYGCMLKVLLSPAWPF